MKDCKEILKRLNYTAWETGDRINSERFLDYIIKIRRLKEGKIIEKDGIKALYSYTLDKVLTESIGISSYKLLSFDLEKEELLEELFNELNSSLLDNKAKLLIFRTSYDYPYTRFLLKKGGRLFGINLHLRKIVDRKWEWSSFELERIPFEKSLLPTLSDLIKTSFNISHLFRNPKIPLERAKEVFCKWLITSSPDEIYIYKFKNSSEIVGISVVQFDNLLSNYHPDPIYRLHLLVVDKRYQNRGIGKSILDLVETELYLKNKKRFILQTGVDSANIKAVRFYIKESFIPFSTSLTFHYWLR